MLRRRRERGATEQDKKDYRRDLSLLDEGAESVDFVASFDLRTRISTLRSCGWSRLGNLMDVLSGHRVVVRGVRARSARISILSLFHLKINARMHTRL